MTSFILTDKRLNLFCLHHGLNCYLRGNNEINFALFIPFWYNNINIIVSKVPKIIKIAETFQSVKGG